MHHEDSLSEFEQQLSAWRPAGEGLESDALLYRAGLEAGKHTRPRTIWPALCGVMALACAALGYWGLAERAGHLAVAQQLHQQHLLAREQSESMSILPASYVPAQNDYFQLRHQAEVDPGWLAVLPTKTQPTALQPSDYPILRAGQIDRLQDQ